jgi:hypothetical protein
MDTCFGPEPALRVANPEASLIAACLCFRRYTLYVVSPFLHNVAIVEVYDVKETKKKRGRPASLEHVRVRRFSNKEWV